MDDEKMVDGKHTSGDDEILEFAADVANCALMVADVCGALLPADKPRTARVGASMSDEQGELR